MDNINAFKRNIRERMLAKRKNFDEELYSHANSLICQNIVNLLKQVGQNKSVLNIGLYWPLPAEPDLLKLIFIIDNQFSLPAISGTNMDFVKYYPGDMLEETTLKGIQQPKKKTSILPNIVIAPGLAFNLGGYRIGFGVGHYDRYFAKIKSYSNPISIGVCFHDDLVENLPIDENDHKFNYIITEKMTIKI